MLTFSTHNINCAVHNKRYSLKFMNKSFVISLRKYASGYVDLQPTPKKKVYIRKKLNQVPSKNRMNILIFITVIVNLIPTPENFIP